jgi:hypothetical protein
MASSHDKENLPILDSGANADVGDPAMPATPAAPAASKKGRQKAADEPSNSTKAVWRDSDDKVVVETLLKEREEGHQSNSGFKPVTWTACADALKGSEQKSGGITKSASSCHDHWGKVRIPRDRVVAEILIAQT